MATISFPHTSSANALPAIKRAREHDETVVLKKRRIKETLETVDYSSHYKVTDQEVIDRLSTISHLGEFTIDFATELTDRVLEALKSKAAQLRVLKIESTSTFSEAALISLFRDCHQLRTLSVGWIHQEVTDNVIEVIAQNSQLRELNIGHCTEVTHRGMRKLIPSCLQLEKLDIRYCTGMTTSTLDLLCRKSSSLRELHIDWDKKLTDSVVENTLGRACFSLEILDLCLSDKITDIGIAIIAKKHPTLKVFYLSGFNRKRTDLSLNAFVTYCPQLERLDVSCWTAISNQGIRTLLSKNKIKELNLGNCDFVNDETIEIVKQLGTAITSLELALGTRILKETLAHLTDKNEGLRALEILSLYYIKKVDKQTLQSIIDCGKNHLKTINITGTEAAECLNEINRPKELGLIVENDIS